MILQTSVPVTVTASILVGVVAGVIATLAMDLVMGRIDEGETPPRIASGVLTGVHPDDSPRRLASVVHYVAGGLTGPLFVWLVFAVGAVLGVGWLAVGVAGILLYPLMVGFFALVVLPRSRGLARQRLRRIRRAWAIEAVAYLLVLVPLVGVAIAAL
ncbi:hypothetical protein Hbl1158_11525 [Halobaculum sp. CBA1158]|uniref:hypothetical protein n=1 Tax=Halobaculum sp. CBA1158 TaxID=2904243 RepID=UPI001F3341C4|nr:hypothetical protein [Halobaculum sp. CBA1158]UIO99160.1 hypothetical protein Hbl1158_11525 [Halobaculum sp. CBA1158]